MFDRSGQEKPEIRSLLINSKMLDRLRDKFLSIARKMRTE